MRLRLLVICGPTAGGKTRLGVRVASRLGSEIISADSRQVYRGLDIGTGKDLEEYRAVTPHVPYHLIDVADPRGVYSLFDYQHDCYRVLEDKAAEAPFSEGIPLIMVGGTGLYVEAILKGYRIADVPENPSLRQRLAERPHHLLVDELTAADPELAARTDCDNTRRVIRALEIATYGKDHPVRTSAEPPVLLDYRVFALDIAPQTVAERIGARLATRVDEGLVDEVERLLEAGIPMERLLQLGLEYREVAQFLAGHKSRETMLDDLAHGIRRFAKRQRTWFRGLEKRGIPVTWIQPDDIGALLDVDWT